MKKIMFNDKYGLTKAVLEGRKTMTRRIVEEMAGRKYKKLPHPKYKVGEVVAVAQAYKDIPNPFYGRATDKSDAIGLDNKMFVRADLMPHQIRITNVRVERLKDISDEDCKKEGLEFRAGWTFHRHRGVFASPREAFAALIDRISGKGTWQANPYCFCYTFELIR